MRPSVSATVPLTVVPAVLLAALLHAGWNAIAHALPDRLVAFALIGSVSVVGGGVAVAAAPGPAPASWGFVVVSALLHVLYNLLLMRSFLLGDFSQVYPLARGASVALVTLSAALVVGEPTPPVRLAGVGLVCAGLAALVLPDGRPRRSEAPAVVAAIGTAVMIAAYSTVDGVGVRRSGSVIGYTGWLFLLQGTAMPLLAALGRGRALLGQARPHLARGLAGGVFSLLAYGLVLWAQTRGPLAPVAALRETSVLIGAVIGAVGFREPFGRHRVVAAALVTLGVVLANLSR